MYIRSTLTDGFSVATTLQYLYIRQLQKKKKNEVPLKCLMTRAIFRRVRARSQDFIRWGRICLKNLQTLINIFCGTIAK